MEQDATQSIDNPLKKINCDFRVEILGRQDKAEAQPEVPVGINIIKETRFQLSFHKIRFVFQFWALVVALCFITSAKKANLKMRLASPQSLRSCVALTCEIKAFCDKTG